LRSGPDNVSVFTRAVGSLIVTVIIVLFILHIIDRLTRVLFSGQSFLY